MSAERDTPEKLEGDALLAAEYALGVLEGEAREQAEARIKEDRAFAAEVEAWHARLVPLTDGLPEQMPSASVKGKIEARLFGADDVTASDRAGQGVGGWLESLIFWRGATAVAASVAAIAVAFVFAVPSAPPPADPGAQPGFFAALRAQDASPVVLVRYDPDAGQLFISGPVERDGSEPVQPELWVIPPGEGAAPRSLGLIASVSGDLTERVGVDAQTGQQIAQGATLAISLEPPGGSPTGAPTGPVIALGAVQTL